MTWSAIVSFHPPTDFGGSPITGYTVTSIPGGIIATGTSSPIIVSGLTDGVLYVFTVHAINADGPGPESLPSNAAPMAYDLFNVKPLSLISSSLVAGTYYTTTLYPFLVSDTMNVGSLSMSSGHTFTQPNPVLDQFTVPPLAISSGSLAVTVAYQTYNNVDAFTVVPLAISSGTLASTITYKTYNDLDAFTVVPLVISSGSLAETVEYITNNYPNEAFTVNSLSISSGSLA